MDAPKCRSCGERHWGNCVSQMDISPMANVMANSTSVANNMANDTEVERKPVVSSTYKYRDIEARRRYQRDHMRRVRGKKNG